MSNELNALNETETNNEETQQLITPQEIIPSMDEFKDEINHSFKKIEEGDIIKGIVIGISETEVILDLGYYAEGIIKLEELSNDPRFSIKADVALGEEISATVLREDDGNGNILLSRKKADDILAWVSLQEYYNNKTVLSVKIAATVNAGVITYLNGIRAFIPASQLSLSYVEDLSSYIGREVSVVIITVDENSNKLVLSAKEVELEKEREDKSLRISKLQVGLVTTGTVDKITTYGAFVNIGDGLSGLVHISQICGRRIKSPNEVIKEGETVTVKVLDINNGKVSLSMKAVENNDDVLGSTDSVPFEYTSEEQVSTGLASLLANIKL